MNADPTPDASAEDPLIDELREIRRKICEQFDNDVEKLCDHLQELERQQTRLSVDPNPSISASMDAIDGETKSRRL